MADTWYVLGDSRMAAAMIACLSLSITCLLITIEYQELRHELYFIDFFDDLKYNRIRYPLNRLNYEKFVNRFDFITKYIMNQMFWISSISVISMLPVSLFLVYLKGDITHLKPLYLIFWSIIAVIFCLQIFGTLWLGAVLWYASTYYLKLKFNEVYYKMVSLEKSRNLFSSVALVMTFKEHNYLMKITEDFNHLFKFIIFYFYFIATPGFQIGVYGTHHSATHLYVRIFGVFIFIISFTNVFVMNFMNVWICKTSKKPYSVLFSFISRSKTPIPLENRMKINSFIEHLSGHEIGFYCYDLFPMNYYEFYQYIYIFGLNYILIMNLF